MCEGYWETCICEDCKKVKELFSDLSFYWDNEEEREDIERTIESMGYSIQPLLLPNGRTYEGIRFYKKRKIKIATRILKAKQKHMD